MLGPLCLCLCMYEHVLVQLFLSNPLLVREDLLTHTSSINTSWLQREKIQERQRIVTKEERACFDTSTKDASFHPSTGWKMKTEDYLKSEKVWVTSQFHSFLEPCLCGFYLETRGFVPPFMAYALFWYPRDYGWAVRLLDIMKDFKYNSLFKPMDGSTCLPANICYSSSNRSQNRCY